MFYQALLPIVYLQEQAQAVEKAESLLFDWVKDQPTSLKQHYYYLSMNIQKIQKQYLQRTKLDPISKIIVRSLFFYALWLN